MRLKSRYGNKKVSCQQYAVELICENKAKSSGIDLPNEFWKLPIWKSYYIVQMKFLSSIRSKYDDQDHFDRFIIDFIKKNRVWSINPKIKWLSDKIQEDIVGFKSQKTAVVHEQSKEPVIYQQKQSKIDLDIYG